MTQTTSQIELLGSRISSQIRRYMEKVQAGETPLEEMAKISSACRELDAVVTPPEIWTNRVAMGYNGSIAICLLFDLNIFQFLSESDSPAPLETLVKRSGASKSLLRCALREVVAQLILDEPFPETYRLNIRSAFLLDRNGGAWVHHMSDVGLMTGAFLSRYVTQNGGKIPAHRHQTAFQMAHQTDQSFYAFLRSSDRKLGERFDRAMQWHRRSATTTVESIFDFNQLKADALVVDVGGGMGHHSIRIAQHHPRMSFIIQDYGAQTPAGSSDIDETILERVKWQDHDFRTEQPVKGADLYLASCILMDYTPADCCTILGHLADAMTPNKSILLIDDAIDVGNQGGLSMANAMNMHLLACFGALSRTMEEWYALVERVPGGLSIVDSWMSDPGRVTLALKRVR
ncbi:sterigmatocystin 8-O-methyltransferase [Aspergillus udagawae]|uniref:Sterigmatocystin 8-O-methyltransferase n=1 Tax=Aspergillus udagawae TaxID=91492 RepID=A0ABQ1AME4_9EURO|nr:sterigmatocystin 8-O-methyltransferase [Aspergillus udagawae]GFF84577.1 sterigmatocystin 8-O-methyltransferase [Aspergillus udagawae]GFG13375.1 sterigmatocystin 8-O-methyltransferase [Aspergillus udagawae]GFG20733.1 sterigmatocystin 8-O-methyltransferase [Aspergillus udagawae]